jgi:hypothetical protein
MPMSLEEEVRLLSMVDILGPLSDEELEDLAKRAPDTFLEQDDILYTPKESTERLFILKKGRVQCYEIDEGGNEITLSVVEDGNVFGEMALFNWVEVILPLSPTSCRPPKDGRLVRIEPALTWQHIVRSSPEGRAAEPLALPISDSGTSTDTSQQREKALPQTGERRIRRKGR